MRLFEMSPRYGLCFDGSDEGVYSSNTHGPEYMWQRLRDLVDGCWIKDHSVDGRNEGQLIVRLIDRYMLAKTPVPHALIDQAIKFLQFRTAHGYAWRLSGNELSLRKLTVDDHK